MSLDIAVMNDHDGIERYVSIGVKEHHRLMSICRRMGDYELLIRFSDYYEEGEIFHQELLQLTDELRRVEAQANSDPELTQIIREIIGLVKFAQGKRRSVVAIPD